MTTSISQLVNSHVEWVERYIARGFQPTFASIMFNPLPGNEAAKQKQMIEAIESVYTRHLKRAFRRPRKVPTYEMPFWITCFDWPVPKKGFNRDHLANIVINDGMHMHGVWLTPPWTRIKVALDLHLHDEHDHYFPRPNPIHRVIADPIDSRLGYTVRYGLKSLSRRRLDAGDVLVLPRSHSEYQRLKKNETPRDLAQARILQRNLLGL